MRKLIQTYCDMVVDRTSCPPCNGPIFPPDKGPERKLKSKSLGWYLCLISISISLSIDWSINLSIYLSIIYLPEYTHTHTHTNTHTCAIVYLSRSIVLVLCPARLICIDYISGLCSLISGLVWSMVKALWDEVGDPSGWLCFLLLLLQCEFFLLGSSNCFCPSCFGCGLVTTPLILVQGYRMVILRFS